MQPTEKEANQLVNLLIRKTVAREVEWNRSVVRPNDPDSGNEIEVHFFAHVGPRTLELTSEILRLWFGEDEEVDIELNGLDFDVELENLIEAVEECFARPPLKVQELNDFLTELSSAAH